MLTYLSNDLLTCRTSRSGSAPACGADETIFDVGEPDIVRPLVGADRVGMAAAIIGAIDQDTANAGFAHLAKGDLLGLLFGP